MGRPPPPAGTFSYEYKCTIAKAQRTILFKKFFPVLRKDLMNMK